MTSSGHRSLVKDLDMPVARRVFVSMPADNADLTNSQNSLKWGIVKDIEAAGYTAEIFVDPRGGSGRASSIGWSAVAADRVMRSCAGAAIIGLPRWQVQSPEGQKLFPTEYCHYESAVAFTLGLPMLVVVQADVERRVVFSGSYGTYIGEFPARANSAWLRTREWQTTFEHWRGAMDKRRDIFLGYCSTSSATAAAVSRFLQNALGAKVLDWQTDFTPGQTILGQIEEAAARCGAGIFLFTRDDELAGGQNAVAAIPRDNVVFEAGYFIQAKGKNRVLIVREDGVKMPADLGGDIYASLENKLDIGPIVTVLQKFVEGL
jgi:hypothetical protein